MRSLRLVGLSEDGRSLVLAAEGADGTDDGERFELPVDDRLRAAARGDTRRLGQIEADGGLSPRVIQSRIRAGETPEQVAASSGTRVERIMRFAHTVLQERSRLAEQAREARVRLSEGIPGAPLQQFMAERLRLLGADLDAVRWDAARAEDGTWVVTAAWRAGAKEGTTLWVYDVPARTVTPADQGTRDFAEGTRLVRVVPGVPAERPIMPVHRSAAVPERTPAPAAEEPPAPVAAPAAERRTDAVPLTDDEIAEHDTVVLRTGETDGEDEDPRARVPAWEDIVFGVRRNR
ncbi:septation protein SepH [Geodermatophilus sp. FMUSA9-8]|uniref:septation protein SepH n=1 Tax=Geodermatophilus sp. FMUSA9-8 TaxID=3120155 RepID=UPI00300BC455